MTILSQTPAFTNKSGFWQKLTNQLAVILSLCTILPVLFVGVYSVYAFSNALSNLATEKVSAQVQDEAEQIAEFLQGIERDTLFLGNAPGLTELIAARDRAPADPDAETTPDAADAADPDPDAIAAAREQLQTLFARQMAAKPDYMQLRYLDETGQEIVRVDSDGTTVTPIATDRLQNKGDRGYFTNTMALSVGEIYVSPLNLNRERGEIERPFNPVIRYATPVFNASGEPRGIVIINTFTQRLLEEFEVGDFGEGTEFFVLNRDGYYIYHPNADKRWGFDLDTDERLSNDYAAPVADAVLSGETGTLDNVERSLFGYTSLTLGDQVEATRLTFVASVPHQIIFASVVNFEIVTTAIVLVAVLAAVVLGIARIRQVVVLVKRLSLSIADFTLELASTLAQQEQIATNQSDSVRQVTATLSDVGADARQNAGQAETVTSECQEVFGLSQSGTQRLKSTLDGMLSLQKQVDFIAQQSQHLGSQTENIGNITNLAALVSDLANQTNMLALNAAVEAVRAGERGRGFGVVATEIRKLADQSQDAAAKIAAVVPEIQTAIAATLKATRAGAETVQAGLSSVEGAVQAFEQLRATADTMLSSSQDISQTVERQADAVRGVTEAMQAINQGAAQAAVGISNTKQRVEELRGRARQLQSLV